MAIDFQIGEPKDESIIYILQEIACPPAGQCVVQAVRSALLYATSSQGRARIWTIWQANEKKSYQIGICNCCQLPSAASSHRIAVDDRVELWLDPAQAPRLDPSLEGMAHSSHAQPKRHCGTRYSLEERLAMVSAYLAGATAKALEDRHNVGHCTILKWYRAYARQAKAMAARGAPLKFIASAMNLDLETVRRLLEKQPWKTPPYFSEEAKFEAVKAYFETGKLSSAANAVGCSYPSVRTWTRQLLPDFRDRLLEELGPAGLERLQAYEP